MKSMPLSERLSVHLAIGDNYVFWENGTLDRAVIWDAELGGPKELCIRLGPDPSWGMGGFLSIG